MTNEFKKFVIGIVCLLSSLVVVAVLLPPFWEAMRFNNCLAEVVTATRSCTNYALSATQNAFTDDGSIASEVIGDQTFYNGSAQLTVKGVEAKEIYIDLVSTDESNPSEPTTYLDSLVKAGDKSYLSVVGSLIGQPLGGVSQSLGELLLNAESNSTQPFYTPTNFNVAYINDELLKSQIKKSLLTLAQSQTTADGNYQWVFDLDSVEVNYYKDSSYNETFDSALPVLENMSVTSGGTVSSNTKKLMAVFGALGEEDSTSPIYAFNSLINKYTEGTTLREQFDKRWDLSWYTSDDSIWSRVPTYYVEIEVPWYFVTSTPSFNIDSSRGGMTAIQKIRESFAEAIASGSDGFTTPTVLLTGTSNTASLTTAELAKVEEWCDFWNTDDSQVLISGGTLIIRRTVTGLS